MEINLLQISDLHFHQDGAKRISLIRDSLINDLKGLNKSIDVLIFAGDIVQEGENSEKEYVNVFNCFINPIKDSLALKDDSIFIVPGNHDIDRSKVVEHYENGFKSINSLEEFDKFYEGFKKKPDNYTYLDQKLKQYLSFKEKIYNNNKNIIHRSYFYDLAKININNISLGFICLNSTWRSSQFGDDQGRLILGRPILEEAVDEIKSCDVRIAMAHHPLDMLSQWDKKEVSNTMAKHINLFLAGHRHSSDSLFTQHILGSFFTSTCASLYHGRYNIGYSLISMVFPENKLTIYLRKWYDSRNEFDQETDKIKDGIVTYNNFNCLSDEAGLWLKVNEIKAHMKRQLLGEYSLMPLIYIDDKAKIEDVFVEPIITDHSSFEKSLIESKVFKIKDLLKRESNILFFGGKEYGKTILLEHIKSQILSDDISFHCTIPILINFLDLPKNNPLKIKDIIREKIDYEIANDEIENLLSLGKIIFLIDDYNDPNDDYKENRNKLFINIYRSYPKCRIIFAMNEDLSHTFKQTAPELTNTYKADSFYLQSFNTTKIRELLINWNKYKSFDVDFILNQIVFYFNKLKIPVTPLAVTLFLGALFVDPSNKAIKNEAYLIDKYLETILEKLNKEEIKSEMDFHDKETFLSYIALLLVRKNKFKLNRNEFEIDKNNYFSNLGLDIPNPRIFDDFFNKGILQEVDNQVSFKFKFWFNYFLANSMHNDQIVFKEIISLKNYLKYSTAFSYKAGLARNDLYLLKIINNKIREQFNDFGKSLFKLKSYQCETVLNEFSDDIEKDIRERNRPEDKDKIKDIIYLSDDVSKQDIEGEDELFDSLIKLVLLDSEIIRNTTNIAKDQKETYLRNNIRYYILLLWRTLEEFKSFISSVSYEEIQKAIWGKAKSVPPKDKIEKTIDRMKNIVYKTIPLSIIICMTEYLCNPKLANTVISLLEKEENIEQKLFYALLLLKLDFDKSVSFIKSLIRENKEQSVDMIIFQFIYIYAFINILPEKHLNIVVNLLDTIRKKFPHAKIDKKDTFVSDTKKNLLLSKKTLKR